MDYKKDSVQERRSLRKNKHWINDLGRVPQNSPQVEVVQKSTDIIQTLLIRFIKNVSSESSTADTHWTMDTLKNNG